MTQVAGMTELDIEQARFNMIEQQIRPWDVLDSRVLQVLADTPREQFVPEAYASMAFVDMEVPLGEGEVMMAPKVEGRLLQALELQPSDVVLEVGTGSGYLTACLARLAAQVDSVERIEAFKLAAQRRLADLGIDNAGLRTGDASRGWDQRPRYDAIAVTGSMPEYHDGFEAQLALGGRLFVIVGEPPIMEAMLVRRVGESSYARSVLFETSIPPLVGLEKAPEFVF
jgi:protein-L-isoaspartate(D-aspartate) O-methyltransferase